MVALLLCCMALTAPLFTVTAADSIFDCPKITIPPAPQNITRLHPGHVSVVMAMGDSITAAFAARSSVYEARDLSWSIGEGSSGQVTLPWLIANTRTK